MAKKGRVMATVKFKRPAGYWGVGLGGLWPAKRHHLDLRGKPAGIIEFELSKGAIKRGYHFDTDDPIWVDVDDGNCPPTGRSHPDIVVHNRPARNRVTVTNRKVSGPVRLRYQLNVLDGSGQPAPIDPIIEN